MTTPPPANPINPDVTKRVEYLWEELRDERANQYASVDAIHVVCTALVGFQSVLLTLVPSVGLAIGWRLASMIALSLSVAVFLWTLLRRPPGVPKQWWQRSGGTLTTIDPNHLATLIQKPSDDVLLRLYRAERAMVKQNLLWLIKPKRVLMNLGAYLFVVALFILGLGSVIEWSGGK
ncbi:hypothetical protein [Streptomyces sp. NBC_00076]|uniref:hypothetical protein n=1 Tax=Streptomyces sp. NBC_00076 TaxID=2975642 RepID=UPI00324FAC8F